MERRKRLVRFGAVLSGVVAALAVVAISSAHVEPVTTSPAAGTTVTVLPAQVTMDASEAMAAQGSSLVVVNASGTQVNTTASAVDPANPKRMSVGLPSGLPAGVYTVKWTTVSEEDGDAASGSWSFTYAPAQATVTATASSTPTATSAAPSTPTAGATRVATAVATPQPVTPPKTGMAGLASPHRSWTGLLALALAATGLAAGARAAVTRR